MKYRLTFLLVVTTAICANAQGSLFGSGNWHFDPVVFINPGVKIGGGPGRIVGIELSVGVVTEPLPMVALVCGLQNVYRANEKGEKKRISASYAEIELGVPLAGVAFGKQTCRDPSLADTYVRLFAGYYGYLSWRIASDSDVGEIAFVGKYPILLTEP